MLGLAVQERRNRLETRCLLAALETMVVTGSAFGGIHPRSVQRLEMLDRYQWLKIIGASR